MRLRPRMGTANGVTSPTACCGAIMNQVDRESAAPEPTADKLFKTSRRFIPC